MNSREAIFLHHTLRYQDGILKVIPIPRHERDTHVLAQGEFTHIDRWTVTQDVTTHHGIALAHYWTLIDTRVLVRTRVLGEVINIYRGLIRTHVLVIDSNHNTTRIHRINHAAALCDHTHAGIRSNVAFHTCAYQRLVSAQCRHCLSLHV